MLSYSVTKRIKVFKTARGRFVTVARQEIDVRS